MTNKIILMDEILTQVKENGGVEQEKSTCEEGCLRKCHEGLRKCHD